MFSPTSSNYSKYNLSFSLTNYINQLIFTLKEVNTRLFCVLRDGLKITLKTIQNKWYEAICGEILAYDLLKLIKHSISNIRISTLFSQFMWSTCELIHFRGAYLSLAINIVYHRFWVLGWHVNVIYGYIWVAKNTRNAGVPTV